METLTNAASSVSKAIWGENTTAANETGGQEPISGEQGKGTASEPFDKGNAENPTSLSHSSSDPVDTSTTASDFSKSLRDNPTSSNDSTSFGETVPSSTTHESNIGDKLNPASSDPVDTSTASDFSKSLRDNSTSRNDTSSFGEAVPSSTTHESRIGEKLNPASSNPVDTSRASGFSNSLDNSTSRNDTSSFGTTHESRVVDKLNFLSISDTPSNPAGTSTASGFSDNLDNSTSRNDTSSFGEAVPSSTTHHTRIADQLDPNIASNEPSTGDYRTSSTPNMSDTANTSTPNITNQEPTGSQPPVSERPISNTINAAQGGPPRPEHETDKTGVVGGMSDSRKAEDIRPTEASDNPGAAPHSAARPGQKQQGADAPLKAPEGEEASAVKEKKDEGEEALAKRDPNDHSGEPMHIHNATEEKKESAPGQEGGKEHGKEEGTGEQWVKTSGLAAEGGDFDATKPGAGREADRLMEQKGIHKTQPGQPTPEPASTSTGDHGKGDKPSLGQKVKDKLHLGHKDK